MPSSPPTWLWSIQGEGGEEYGDPAAFFRITYATEGLRRVLTATVARLAGRGGEPVIGLQTNFGGGKTHTMLALHHLAGATEAGYPPERLDGMGPIFEAAGVETLGRVTRAVFVGTHKGAAEAMHAENGREIRTLWGYLAWRLGGWKAVDTIADSEAAGTNPGSERLIPILREAAPCLVLMDEVVAFARQLRGLQHDAFHAFIQSLTEAAAAVEGAVVVGSLPESGAEVGDENARRERAWQSILDDPDLGQNLTLAQMNDAEAQARRSRDALRQSVRGAWVHVLYPGPSDAAGTEGAAVGRGYVIASTRIVNRGGGKSVPEAVWDKVSTDGTVFGEIGPANLMQSLEPIWPTARPHLNIEEIRDWFSSYVYLPRLRDEATLDGALQRLVENMADAFAYASGFDEETGAYEGVVDGRTLMPGHFESGLLVRREAIPSAKPDSEPIRPGDDGGSTPTPTPSVRDDRDEAPTPDPRPRRFFASLEIDPERAGLEVARIMDGLLVELTRAPGSNLRLHLEIEGAAGGDGYPEDVVDTVKANARDLGLDGTGLGFEEK